MNRNSKAIIFGICCGVATLVYLGYDSPSEPKDAEAQFQQGLAYWDGEGVAMDKVKAVKWWRKVAEQGYANAQYNLALAYFRGEGITEDKAEMVKWLRKAAEQGHVNAQGALGSAYRKGEGVAVDKVKSVKWFRKAAEQGSARAQYHLGYAYFFGVGITYKDRAEAVKWWRKAAEQGNTEAKSSLSTLTPTKPYVERYADELRSQFLKNDHCNNFSGSIHHIATSYLSDDEKILQIDHILKAAVQTGCIP